MKNTKLIASIAAVGLVAGSTGTAAETWAEAQQQRRSALCAEMPACSEADDVMWSEIYLAELCSPWGLKVGNVRVLMPVATETAERQRAWRRETEHARKIAERALRTGGIYDATSRSSVRVEVQLQGNPSFVEVRVERPARIDYTSRWQRKEFWRLHKRLAGQPEERWKEWTAPKRWSSQLPAGPYASSVDLTVYTANTSSRPGAWDAKLEAALQEIVQRYTLVQQHPACIELTQVVKEYDRAGRSDGPVASIDRLRVYAPEYTAEKYPDLKMATAIMRAAGSVVIYMMERCGRAWPEPTARCSEPEEDWLVLAADAVKHEPEYVLQRVRELFPILQGWTDEVVTVTFAERFSDIIVRAKRRCGSSWPQEPCTKAQLK